MKKTKIKTIPHFPTRFYDEKAGAWVHITEGPGALSHAEYDGETQWSEERTADGRWIQLQPVMVHNLPFKTTLSYYDYYRGRSAAGAYFVDEHGRRFTVFMTDLSKFIPMMVNGKITGEFIYCKRGRNYGITLWEE